ncbi:MAG: N-acetylmuramoyl-L-alanine amidase [Chloroflexus sp.]|uniref:N-acetylmuramoyl-L-alanine amidase n=1 Tax=Chloroflexus sp. TaxID=1904827 RepID=UPI0021DD49B2|nr:N-acetylmuramoyl-L-alanine amidase [Chloroflexus sp.]GIV88198.1 MAG: N-acetylmuramoyl-L-alanine amidase [Chloroflexus sp.]
MRLRNRLAIIISLLWTMILPLTPAPAAPTVTADGRPDEQLFVTNAGAAAADTFPLLATTNGYLTPPTPAPRSFTHLLLRWSVEPAVPTSIAVRVSNDGITWSDWVQIAEDPELWQPNDGPDVHWSEIIYAGDDRRWYQVRIDLADPTAFHSLRVSLVDSRFGPATPVATPAASTSAVNRPPIVSRTAWGNPHGQSSPQAPPAYYPVRHMVIHHTASSNTLAAGQTWADVVRSIWSFHTYTRGWGDIGYNYLIDPNGVIYEGRAGGDDVVGFHDTANYGSMGVSLIGTYSTIEPTAAAVESLVALLAWKADQKHIDPMGRSFYYGCSISRYCAPFNPGAVLDHISGHRQVTPNGYTTCPGDRLFNLLPLIRQQVQARLAGESQPDNGDLVIEEHESGFVRSNASWYQRVCGYGGRVLYTYATDRQSESTNWATWRPTLPAAGVYRVLVHIPDNCAPLDLTRQARYRITTAGGTIERVVDQAVQQGWVDLGSYNFATSTARLELSDLTGEPLALQRAILFDAVQWQPIDTANQRLELVAVEYGATTIAAGEVLPVRFTVRNVGTVPIYGQDPPGGTVFDLSSSTPERNGYVYDEGECFLGNASQSYPVFPKEAGRFRVMLGPTDRSVPCVGETGGYPWRWGIDGRLDPGESQTIVGYVRFRVPGVVTLRAGAIHEYVTYAALNQAEQQITITPERQPPQPARYDELLQPLAMVYRLANTPMRLLARTQNPLSVRRGELLGSFVWNGELRAWGDGGPLPNLHDHFLIEQTRTFIAPVEGVYTFELSSDDGAWLWVNEQLVIANPGLHPFTTITGTITLPAGIHTLAIKYFEVEGEAAVGYRIKEPGATEFRLLRDGLVEGEGVGNHFRQITGLRVSASDLGGGGAGLRYSWDGETWITTTENNVTIGALTGGTYHLRYQALDRNGNESEIVDLHLRVDSDLIIYQSLLPMIMR